MAKIYNSQFVPPAEYNHDDELYYVACNATVPDFHVQIGGEKFKIDARDQIVWPDSDFANGKAMCVSGIQDGGLASDSHNTFLLCVNILLKLSKNSGHLN